jgi:hypothetical protein
MDKIYSPFSDTNSNKDVFSSRQNNPLFSNHSDSKSSDIRKRNTDLTSNKISNWKKVFTDKVVRRINDRRESRLDSIVFSKQEILEEIKHENLINGYCEEDNLILADYFDKILALFESDKVNSREYELEVCLNSNISVCPFCSYPVILSSNKVICMNLCFEYYVNPIIFNENFSLDNFVDLLTETYKNHKNCLNSFQYAKFELLYFENEVSFICGSCFKKSLINS